MSQQKMRIHNQYVKDLSLENPNSPFLSLKEVPNIDVMVNVNSVKLEGSEGTEGESEEKSFHEITLHIEAKAMIKDENIKDGVAFICETKYCGIFSVENFAELSTEEVNRALFIGGPTFLFPFAREVIARVTSSGGFPPLMLDPIDFEAMYEQQSRQQKSNASNENFN
ncbi:protein-export chaperone SecB [Wolbachia endosymbiont of Brugia malayi]|uniref:Protein-export protein SecB n=1 Tax=Wolbachia sp. subsp. Brugia malayi (strain TRS) TaxID=292805 RepID=SECB_WOLTR|nr:MULTISPECIES: protein-export chaperone SecB [unclassified Wolbachia]Q5GS95.1 RecName: Full=Protein-export protein SecB [Wolbachia endosymbiont strain TRS of Brugia malayi]AAW71129.1 Preprotein translocase subunit SecB [Wolbachia endosymbiont strain TRS of Brugia malayi]QCB61335.1 protein-export chaperone SecB [Wolbachia endosymbiont of Brugia malayi]QIT35977.1 protein-export chaperone SecB [Wolbachia endosymbiont of Brugia pahangi]